MIDELAKSLPRSFALLQLLGVVQREPISATATRPAHAHYRIDLDPLSTLVHDPSSLPAAIYRAGTAHFDSEWVNEILFETLLRFRLGTTRADRRDLARPRRGHRRRQLRPCPAARRPARRHRDQPRLHHRRAVAGRGRARPGARAVAARAHRADAARRGRVAALDHRHRGAAAGGAGGDSERRRRPLSDRRDPADRQRHRRRGHHPAAGSARPRQRDSLRARRCRRLPDHRRRRARCVRARRCSARRRQADPGDRRSGRRGQSGPRRPRSVDRGADRRRVVVARRHLVHARGPARSAYRAPCASDRSSSPTPRSRCRPMRIGLARASRRG